jgi:tetratricopeptide (TPR) repeat protein
MLSSDRLPRLIHREVVQLILLVLIAIGAFILTRSVAAASRDLNRRDAAAWFVDGERQLGEGRLADAVASLRRATVKDRSDQRYVLALARTLARQHDDAGARTLLLELREGAPEDPQINRELARLAVERRDLTEALRYYHNALYAMWPEGSGDAGRRRVREELIRFLLEQGQNSRALSEILALEAVLPDTVDAHMTGGRLFFEVGDSQRALEQFARARQLDPRNADARHAVRVLRSADNASVVVRGAGDR